MTEQDRIRITNERLVTYAGRMRQHFATPAFCLEIGHDANCGNLVLCCTEDTPADQLLLLLRAATEMLAESIRIGSVT